MITPLLLVPGFHGVGTDQRFLDLVTVHGIITKVKIDQLEGEKANMVMDTSMAMLRGHIQLVAVDQRVLFRELEKHRESLAHAQGPFRLGDKAQKNPPRCIVHALHALEHPQMAALQSKTQWKHEEAMYQAGLGSHLALVNPSRIGLELGNLQLIHLFRKD